MYKLLWNLENWAAKSMSPFCVVFGYILCYLLQRLVFFKIQTSKHKAAPCQKKNSTRENDTLGSDGFSGKGKERGHGTKIFVENQTQISASKSLMTLKIKLFSVLST